MRSLSKAVVAGLAALLLIVGASYSNAGPVVGATPSEAANSPLQAIDPDPSAASTTASDVGTARQLADLESRGEPRGIEPGAGRWKTWAIPSASELRLPTPPDRRATITEIQQLKALASQRDAAARQHVAFWDAGAPSYRWVEIALNQFQAKPVSNPRIQRGMALMNTAIYDALVAAWDSKYAYNRPRPSEFDKNLTTLVPTPNSPSYPAEHAVVAGAASAILSYLYPDDAKLFDAKAQEAAQSRLLAGVQYPSDVKAGLKLGKKVAQKVIDRAKADGSDAK